MHSHTHTFLLIFFLVHTNDKDTPIFNTLTLADGTTTNVAAIIMAASRPTLPFEWEHPVGRV